MNNPSITKVFTDRVTVTYQPPDFDEQKVQNRMEELLKVTIARRTKTLLYKRSARVCLDADFKRSILVQYGPYNSGIRFARVEFNPSKDDMELVKGAINCIFPAGYAGLVAEGVCTRIDATVDLHNKHINDLVLSFPGLSKSSAFMSKGGFETYYLGSKGSKKLRCIYDKNAELKRKGLKPYPYPVTRIECRIIGGCSFSELQQLGNPFASIGVQELSDLQYQNDDCYYLFRALCVSSGAQNALLAVPKNHRQKYRKYLKDVAPEWWNADDIWADWDSAVAPILSATPAFNFLSALDLNSH